MNPTPTIVTEQLMLKPNSLTNTPISTSQEINSPENSHPDPKIVKQLNFLSWFLFATGLFAAVGALYRWGDGSLFNAPLGADLSLFYTDLLVAAPASIIASFGYKKMRKWAILSGALVSGVYIYGSILVYSTVIQSGFPYPLKLVFPPIIGLGLALYLLIWTWNNLDLFFHPKK